MSITFRYELLDFKREKGYVGKDFDISLLSHVGFSEGTAL